MYKLDDQVILLSTATVLAISKDQTVALIYFPDHNLRIWLPTSTISHLQEQQP